MTDDAPLPVVAQVVLDTTSPRRLAEFYRALFGLDYRAGDEPPAPGEPDPRGEDWLVLRNPGGVQLAFQASGEHRPPTWQSDEVPQQLHLDCTVPDLEALASARERAAALGAVELLDRTEDREEPLVVLADPAGHPFCVFVA